ncbi:hypothetical protein Tco_1327230 [Tanacetum coccineum]
MNIRISTKSVNNEAPMKNAEPISAMHPLDFAKNIMDSRNTSFKEGGLSLIGPNAPSYLEVGKRSKVAGKRKVAVGYHGEDPNRKVPAQASKVAGDASTPLNVDSDPDIHEFPSAKELKDATDFNWVVAHVTHPSWKQYLREIIIEQLCNIHDKSNILQAVLYNVLNGRNRELISALYKARDLDKNPLVSDMRTEIETLQSRVNGLHSEYSRLILKDNKWINYEQTLSNLRAKFEGLKSEGKRLRASKIQPFYKRCIACQGIYHSWPVAAFEEVVELKKPFVLEEILGYRPSSKEEYDRVGNDLADASYPFLVELTADPHASVE